MLNHQQDWYQVLVSQSKTDHIYSLIHDGLSADFNPQDPQGFVLIYPPNLPKHLQPFDQAHAVANLEFIEPQFALLKNQYLTAYLEAGTSLEVLAYLKYDYALLNFPLPLKKEVKFTKEEEDPYDRLLSLSNKQPEEIFEIDDPLLFCNELIKRCENRELALELAQQGQQVLENKILQINPDEDLVALLRICTGFNILAITYLWNNKLDEAKKCDTYYIHNPMSSYMHQVIAPYLEMLIAKKQAYYLAQLFKNKIFKQTYLPHYEAYISLLQNPHYPCERMNDMIPIINRVNNGMQAYL